MKNKKWIGIAVLACFIFLCFAVRIYGTSSNPNITRQELESPNTRANRTSIVQKILNDTGNADRFEPESATNILISYGDVLGDGTNEAVIDVEFGPKNSLVAVYKPDGDQYKYIGNLGDFFYIRNIDFLPLPEGKDVIILREYADQNMGAYERSSFLRGYYWDETQFQEVLKVPEGIEATWNDLWDNKTQNGKNLWNRIEQRTDINYTDGNSPSLALTSYQAYKKTPPTDSQNPPLPEDFDTIDSRVVSETYQWSKNWKRFILSEMTRNSTGERVAVIEYLASSPYALFPEYGNLNNKVRIVTKNGTIEEVDKDTLSPVEGSETAKVFFSAH